MKQYAKKLRPYIFEFLSFLLICILFVVVYLGFELIVIKWDFMTISFALLVTLWLSLYVYNFVLFAILVVADLLLKNYVTINAKFKRQYIYKASVFADKGGKGKHSAQTLYYKIVVKHKGEQFILTSAEHYDLKTQKNYDFVIGKWSKAVVDVCIKERDKTGTDRENT